MIGAREDAAGQADQDRTDRQRRVDASEGRRQRQHRGGRRRSGQAPAPAAPLACSSRFGLVRVFRSRGLVMAGESRFPPPFIRWGSPHRHPVNGIMSVNPAHPLESTVLLSFRRAKEAEGTSMERKTRRFGLGDMLILIAALGVAMYGARGLRRMLVEKPGSYSTPDTPSWLMAAAMASSIATPPTLVVSLLAPPPGRQSGGSGCSPVRQRCWRARCSLSSRKSRWPRPSHGGMSPTTTPVRARGRVSDTTYLLHVKRPVSVGGTRAQVQRRMCCRSRVLGRANGRLLGSLRLDRGCHLAPAGPVGPLATGAIRDRPARSPAGVVWIACAILVAVPVPL